MNTSRNGLICIFLLALSILLLAGFNGAVYGQDNGDDEIEADFTVNIEAGLFWFDRNDIRIPNDGGTTFDMIGLISTNPARYIRMSVSATIADRHTFRVLYAPLQKIGTAMFDEPVFFEDTTFEPDTPTDGLYRFNTYRLTYRFTFLDNESWNLGAGVAGLIRDAEVRLTQPEHSASNTDLGFVPLLHLYAERRFGERFSLAVDAEGLASPMGQGRAFDTAITANIRMMENLKLTAGYRFLEGGADVDEVYNFSWINFGLVGLSIDI
ncbi:hypothetical protein DYD21_03260 [Rhodohalobacter sp. SW132]|uniref:hypothetical protein n=1 Tax=Rhodohalobacter sp. SW132 TaxID=2293433 RepID=UPI000E2869E6|nr:hypothetical protein [Rhodohalobacter sp. SW132]REL38988.1 hypothetical protein DYD21_03260 [Rhodohalobacter sp. SW132]